MMGVLECSGTKITNESVSNKYSDLIFKVVICSKMSILLLFQILLLLAALFFLLLLLLIMLLPSPELVALDCSETEIILNP